MNSSITREEILRTYEQLGIKEQDIPSHLPPQKMPTMFDDMDVISSSSTKELSTPPRHHIVLKN